MNQYPELEKLLKTGFKISQPKHSISTIVRELLSLDSDTDISPTTSGEKMRRDLIFLLFQANTDRLYKDSSIDKEYRNITDLTKTLKAYKTSLHSMFYMRDKIKEYDDFDVNSNQTLTELKKLIKLSKPMSNFAILKKEKTVKILPQKEREKLYNFTNVAAGENIVLEAEYVEDCLNALYNAAKKHAKVHLPNCITLKRIDPETGKGHVYFVQAKTKRGEKIKNVEANKARERALRLTPKQVHDHFRYNPEATLASAAKHFRVSETTISDRKKHAKAMFQPQTENA